MDGIFSDLRNAADWWDDGLDLLRPFQPILDRLGLANKHLAIVGSIYTNSIKCLDALVVVFGSTTRADSSKIGQKTPVLIFKRVLTKLERVLERGSVIVIIV